ncbi:UNVERIFIED_ORG: hypothetical protein ABIC97_004606 [Peribacillus simplex]
MNKFKREGRKQQHESTQSSRILDSIRINDYRWIIDKHFVNSIDFLYYLIIPVVWAGFTVGKRAVNIQIVRINGKKIGFGTTLKRYILAGLVYGVTLGIGLLVFSLPFYSQLQPPYEMFLRSVHNHKSFLINRLGIKQLLSSDCTYNKNKDIILWHLVW